jgi:hypothetical protein
MVEKLKSTTPWTSRGTCKTDGLVKQGLSCYSDLYHLQNVNEFLIQKDPSARRRRNYLVKKMYVLENDLKLKWMMKRRTPWMIFKVMMLFNNLPKMETMELHL